MVHLLTVAGDISREYELAAGALGTPTGGLIVARAGSLSDAPPRRLLAGTTGEVEWLLRRGPNTVATWLQDADERQRVVTVLAGETLSVRRPAASAGLVSTVIVTVQPLEGVQL